MLTRPIIAVALALSLGSAAKASTPIDFTEADRLFSERGQDRSKVQAARAAYQSLANQSPKGSPEIVRAAIGAARSSLYELTAYLNMTDPAQKSERKALAGDCWRRSLEAINPANLGYESPAYWYFRVNCIAREAEVSSLLERLANLSRLNDSFDKGLASSGGDIYEGGGIKRIKAVIKGNPEAKGIPGGLYNPEEALRLIDSAIAAEAYPENAPGNMFCENYRRKVSLLIELNRVAEAKTVAQQTQVDFEAYLADEIVPDFIKAETQFCLKELQEVVKTQLQ